jgi:AraC family ethanolamine operon transcriptional activator
MHEAEDEKATHHTIFGRHFRDVDELAEIVNSRRQVQFTQLNRGQFGCELFFLELEEAQFIFTRSIGTARCLGEKAEGYLSFSCVMESNVGNIIAHGHRVPHDTLFGFDGDRGIDLVFPSGLQMCNILIKQDVFAEYLGIVSCQNIDPCVLRVNFLRSPERMLTLRNYLKELWYLIENRPRFLNFPHLKKIVLEDFIPLLIDIFSYDREMVSKPTIPLMRAEVVRQAEDYMMSSLGHPLTLKELSQSLHTSHRPIFYGFQEIFGLSPMAYLKVQRLHGIRRALKLADSKTSSVMAIANQFGFWSAGHFARDYKKMFGELPSDTINRAKN